MRHRTLTSLRVGALAALASLASFALAPGCATQSPDAHGHDRVDLSWLEGAWTTQAWGGTLNVDYATRPDGFTIGYSQLFKDDAPSTPAYHEFEVFGRDADGHYLIPHPSGRPAPRFTLASQGPQRLVYENRKKDFPTRIVYERVGTQLIITLSDPVNNSADQQAFTFTRSAPYAPAD